MAGPVLLTPHDHIAWSYANLARAHAALGAGRTRYVTLDHMVRARLFKGLRTGAMAIGSNCEDERAAKLSAPVCAYCNATERLTLDHLVPRAAGGSDDGINLVAACRSCNSAKGKLDLIAWCVRRRTFPRILLLRRYLKLAALWCERDRLLDEPLAHPRVALLPFDLAALPCNFPPLATLRL